MYVVRDVFKAKPGKAKELVAIFKKTIPVMESLGIRNMRVLTDSVSTYWTVVWESEVDDVSVYYNLLEGRKTSSELEESMKGYMELVTGGHREILKIE